MTMRVYELAKKLGMENRDLIPELKKMGVSVASHSSALDEDIVRKALDKLASKAKGAGKASEVEAGHSAKSAHGVGHAKAGAAKGQPVEEPAKSDKRRILIKRKKEDEPSEAIAAVSVGVSERAPATLSDSVLPPAVSVDHPLEGAVDHGLHVGAAVSAEVGTLMPSPAVPVQPALQVKPMVSLQPHVMTAEALAAKKKLGRASS